MEEKKYVRRNKFKRTRFDEKNKIYSFTEHNQNGDYEGSQILFDQENGNLLMNRFVDKNGNARTIHYKGTQVVMKCNEKYVNGEFVKHGFCEKYEDGKVVEIGNYKEGKKHGRWTYMDLKTKKVEVKRYELGKDISGEEEKQIAREFMASFSDLIDVAEESSISRATQKLIRNIAGMKDIFKKEEIPQIKVDFEEKPTLEEGEIEEGYSSFFQDGSLKIFAEKAKLEEGELKYFGKYFEHFDEGNLKIFSNYNERGELDGIYKEFHENGNLKKEGKYINGELVGEYTEYDKNGNLLNEEKRVEINKENNESKKELKEQEKNEIDISKKIKKENEKETQKNENVVTKIIKKKVKVISKEEQER